MEINKKDAFITYKPEYTQDEKPSERLDFHYVIGACLKQAKYFSIVTDCLFIVVFFALTAIASGPGNSVMAQFILISSWGGLGYLNKIYSSLIMEDAEIIMVRLLHHFLQYLLATVLLYLLLFPGIFTAKNFVLYSILTGGTSFLIRIIFLSVRKKFRHLVRSRYKAAIIGNNFFSEKLECYFKRGISDYLVVSRFTKNELQLFADKSNHYSDIYSISQQGINDIFCCLSEFSGSEIKQLIKEADKYMIRVKFFPDISSFNGSIAIENIGNVPLITVRPEPLNSESNRALKRVFDLFFSTIIIISILSWLTPLLWLVVRIETKGPLFFKQKRAGLNGKIFTCYKFRSMVADNKTSDIEQAFKGDTRVTRVGAFMRKTSLDELPQFFNVLAGEMSVVGPRPHMLAHDFYYRQQINEYMVRHFVKPGITGLAQIRGFRGQIKKIESMRQRVEQDIVYIETWSFFLDLKIIFLTIWNIIQGDKNAY